jgi:hypothetical protein
MPESERKIQVTVCYPDRAPCPPVVMSVSAIIVFLQAVTSAHLFGGAALPERIITKPVDEVSPWP